MSLERDLRFEVTNPLHKRLDGVMFGERKLSLDKDQVTHDLEKSLDRDLRFEVTHPLDKRLDWSLDKAQDTHGLKQSLDRDLRFKSLDKAQVTHGLKRSLDRDLRFEVTNLLDKRLDCVMFGGRKISSYTRLKEVIRQRLEVRSNQDKKLDWVMFWWMSLDKETLTA
ncbi:unnamed protein product [Arabidopsis thaliana]|uniref:Uncharacterized protein n=1 Tax=Arabidopsis thaliana TaxID=3702 RepID=A0A654FUU9_ARATH|nr:unnamed protein product [Arabidopsis thaliana]